MDTFQCGRGAVIALILMHLASGPAQAGTNAFPLALERQSNSVRLRWPSQPEDQFQVEHRPGLVPSAGWQPLATNLSANPGIETTFIHTNALNAGSGYYRVLRLAPPAFTFNWTGTNFTYTDSERTFTGIMLKPSGNGPFPAVIISHGAGGTVNGYSIVKAREMSAWGMVCIGPTLTHAAGGETNPINMGYCPENLARAIACANVLASLTYVDTNRIALFGHSMGAFATIGDAAVLGSRIRAAGITAGGVNSDSPNGTTNAAPTVTEASPVRAPFIMFHCDADPVVPPSRSLLFQQLLITNAVLNQRILYSSNSIPNTNNWHNIHQDPAVNADVLTNTFLWFKARGVLL